MINYTLEDHAAEGVILLIATRGFSMRQEVHAAIADVIGLLEESSEPCTLIMDVRRAHQSIDDIIVGANTIARGDTSLLRHPQIRGLIAVVDQPLLKIASRGLDSEVFGHAQVRVFSTLEDAWDSARS